MQIYVDESGTVGRGLCVVAAALIDPANKRVPRLLRDLHRDASGEAKGSVQTERSRRRFFAGAPRVIEAAAAIIGEDDMRRIAREFGAVQPYEVYAWAAVQVVRPLLRPDVQGVTLDSSPFNRSTRTHVISTLDAACRADGFELGERIVYGDSRQHGGLQVVDVLANGIYGDAPRIVRGDIENGLLTDPLTDAERLTITTVGAVYEAYLTTKDGEP